MSPQPETERSRLLLELALQEDLLGFETALPPLMASFGLGAWACLFPPAFSAGGQPLLISRGIRTDGVLLRQAMREGVRSLSEKKDGHEEAMARLAESIAPAEGGPSQVARVVRQRQTVLTIFLFRPHGEPPFTPGELLAIGTAGEYVERCYQRLAAEIEGEFMEGLLRLVGGLHPEGLCLLDSRRRTVFENRQFREHLHLWAAGSRAAARQLSLPRQTVLPPDWQRACQQCAAEAPSPPEHVRMAVTPSPQARLRRPLPEEEETLEGAVRALGFRSPLGVRNYQLLSTTLRQTAAPGPGADMLAALAEDRGFSRRELDVSRLLLGGCSAEQIATRLKISLPTVKTHTQRLFRKANVRSRLQFAALCSR